MNLYNFLLVKFPGSKSQMSRLCNVLYIYKTMNAAQIVIFYMLFVIYYNVIFNTSFFQHVIINTFEICNQVYLRPNEKDKSVC